MAIYGPEPDTFEGPYAPEFYRAAEVLGDDPAAMDMLRSGYRPPVQYDAPEAPSQGRGWDAFDNVVRSLAGQSLRSQFGRPRRGLESFGVGLAQGILDGRMLDVRRRDAETEAATKRVEDVNAQAAKRTLSAREAAQRLAAARGEKRQAAEAAKVSVPDEFLPYMDPGYVPGERVSADVYRRARDRWVKAKDAPPKAEKPKAEGPTPSRVRTLKGRKATLMTREAQISRRLESLRKNDPGNDKITTLEQDLERVQAELEGVNLELGEKPGEAAPAPKPAPQPKPAQAPAPAAAKPGDPRATDAFKALLSKKGISNAAGLDSLLKTRRPDGQTVQQYADAVGVDLRAVRAGLR